MSPLVQAGFDYYYDESGYYAYILLNGSPQEFETVKAQLGSVRLRCLHSGKSYRPANNRRQYNWFIRVMDAASNCKPSQERIEEYFEHVFNLYSPQKQVRIYEEEKARLQEEKHLLEERYCQLEQDAQRNRTEAREYEELATEVLSEKDLLQQLVGDLEFRIQQIEGEKLCLEFQLNEKNEELVELRYQAEASLIVEGTTSLYDEFEQIVTCLLPNVRFIRKSLKTLFHEFAEYMPALHIVQRVASGDGVERKRVHGTTDWVEINENVNTGQNHHGRIYFKKQSSSYDVLISTKGDQELDVEYMRKY